MKCKSCGRRMIEESSGENWTEYFCPDCDVVVESEECTPQVIEEIGTIYSPEDEE